METIDKGALTAELHKRIREGEVVLNECPSSAIAGVVQAYKNILSFIDNLETKEVNFDIQEELGKYIGRYFSSREVRIAQHFYKTGRLHEYWEEQRRQECPFREVGCKMYKGKVLPCAGACSWVVDHPKMKDIINR